MQSVENSTTQKSRLEILSGMTPECQVRTYRLLKTLNSEPKSDIGDWFAKMESLDNRFNSSADLAQELALGNAKVGQNTALVYAIQSLRNSNPIIADLISGLVYGSPIVAI